MATFTLSADIVTGDETTTAVNLTYKIYNGASLYLTVGSHTSDSNVTLVGTTVTITNVAREDNTSYSFTVTSVDEANNEGIKSNIINITSGPSAGMYASGMYASGMYA